MTSIQHPYDEDGEPVDGHGACCGCLRSEHYIGIDGRDIRNCPNADVCKCSRLSDTPAEFIYLDVAWRDGK